MSAADRLLQLVCKICRWKPPNNIEMSFVEAHFDMEPDHDPEHIQLELVAWCARCGLEMTLIRTEPLGAGDLRHHYQCPGCRRSGTVTQAPSEATP